MAVKEAGVFLEAQGYVAMEAEHYHRKIDTGKGGFVRLPDHGKALSAMKAFPVTESFVPGKDAPCLEYKFHASSQGQYAVTVYMSPSNPVDSRNVIRYALQANDDAIAELNAIPSGAKIGDDQAFWAGGVLNNNRIHSSVVNCVKGENTLRIYAVTPGFVLERIVLNSVNAPLLPSCLGPEESYYSGQA
jgi:hypothetical protein